MGKCSISFASPAKDDIMQIRTYISNVLKNKKAARDTIDIIERAVMSLSEMPERGRKVLDEDIDAQGIRFIIAGNFVIFFRIDAESIIVIRILHNKRNWCELLQGDSKQVKE